MNIPENLKKKMEESWMHVSMKSSQISANSYLVDKQIHDMSYESACAELLPMIDKLEKALMGVSDRHNWMPGLGECVCQNHKDARQALAELNKWRES
jgi:molecular chaperone GrpE (heat shock protein)